MDESSSFGTVTVNLVREREGERRTEPYAYVLRAEGERPMALDVLLQAQATTMPDLAFRFGCRARNCGVCTIDVNGRPRIACRARVKESDTLSPMATLPALSDLVVRRDGIARQLMGRLAGGAGANELNREAPDDYHALTACIECYACLHECPMHQRNLDATPPPDPGNGYPWGNPFSLLKLQRLRLDPVSAPQARAAALETAKTLGLDACRDCPGCKCGVGIDLKGLVVKPLVEAAWGPAGDANPESGDGD
jgi:succinate dehydrogenase / fumarate reductase iron-sulfur subunit